MIHQRFGVRAKQMAFRPFGPVANAQGLGSWKLKEVLRMDRETQHELRRLRISFETALEEVRLASDEDRELIAWRKVQTAGWELNQLLPSTEHTVVR
jgi:hypothetical protein